MLRRLLLTLAAALTLASTATAAPARLTVTAVDPFTVRGSGFHPGERVLVVVVSGGDRASKRVVAGTTGRFVVRFPAVQLNSCAAYTVRTVGSEGSRAVARAMPECPQPLTP